jgi:hypothetical protein
VTKRFNRDLSLRVVQRIDAGHKFPLPDTTKLMLGLPEDADLPEGEEVLDARVRKLSIAKLATLQGLSPTMQNAVLAVFSELEKFAKITNDDGDFEDEETADAWTEFSEGVLNQERLRDGACIAGFIDPPLCETREEAENDPTAKLVWVGSLAETDRARYLTTVLSPESEAAKALEPFPLDGLEGPTTDAVVSITTKAERRPAAKRGGGPK